jgi:hypothetical protein
MQDKSKLVYAARAGETMKAAHARAAGDPAVRSLAATHQFVELLIGPQDLNESLRVLELQIEAASSGKADGFERMLVAQANTLDVIFNQLTVRAAASLSENLHKGETYFRLALKAQNQARATMEATATLKRPSVVIAKHANLNTGIQQVNCMRHASISDETEAIPHLLCSHARTPSSTGASDIAMEAVDPSDGTKDSSRKGQIRSE